AASAYDSGTDRVQIARRHGDLMRARPRLRRHRLRAAFDAKASAAANLIERQRRTGAHCHDLRMLREPCQELIEESELPFGLAEDQVGQSHLKRECVGAAIAR